MPEEKQLATAEHIVFPRVLHQGEYRLWEKADGTLHCVYQPDNDPEPGHFEIPGELVTLLAKAKNGDISPQDMMKLAMKFMMGGGGLVG